MAKKRNYLKIEEKIFKSIGKTGYIVIFIILFILLLSIVDFILYCFLDNYYTSRFLFSGEMKFADWWNSMWTTYKYSYFKMGFFSLILLCIGIYRGRTLAQEFSK